MWQHLLPNCLLRTPMQQKLDVIVDDTFPSVMVHTSAGCRGCISQSTKIIPKNYTLRRLRAKCFGSLWHHPSSLASRLHSPRICREWYRANGQSTFTALENLTSVPHFLYCITAMCRFARTLFRSRGASCASLGLSSTTILNASLVPISKSIVSSEENCTVTKLFVLGLLYFRAFLHYIITSFVPLLLTITVDVSQVQ